jgi:O-antigen ligase
MIGIVLTLVIYIFFAALRKRQENPISIGATATLLAYPAIVAVVTAVVLLWKRARNSILGGGQHQSSNIARDRQWDRGWDLIAQNPFGYGLDRSAEVLNFRNAGGELTIDSYYLSVMLDFGIIALPIFVMLFSLPMYFAIVSLKRARTLELQLLAPLAMGLFNFVIIKSVLSSTSNFPLAFAMMGFMVALVARMQSDDRASDKAEADAREEARGSKRVSSAIG